MIFKNKKADINQIFVYLVSMMIIVFVGYLGVSFSLGFFKTVDTYEDGKLLDDIKKDYEKISIGYGEFFSGDYKLKLEVKQVCFFEKKNVDNINGIKVFDILNSNSNVIFFDDTKILQTEFIGEFKVENTEKYFCVNNVNNNLKLEWENKKNKVFLIGG